MLCVLAFVVIGRASHQDGESLAGVTSTAWPFLAGLAAGEAATRAWRRPAALVPTGVGVWLATVALGQLLRARLRAGHRRRVHRGLGGVPRPLPDRLAAGGRPGPGRPVTPGEPERRRRLVRAGWRAARWRSPGGPWRPGGAPVRWPARPSRCCRCAAATGGRRLAGRHTRPPPPAGRPRPSPRPRSATRRGRARPATRARVRCLHRPVDRRHAGVDVVALPRHRDLRGRAEPHLCPARPSPARWVGAVSVLGWRLIPIFKGRQPPCGGKASDLKIFPAVAASEGTWAADSACGAGHDAGHDQGQRDLLRHGGLRHGRRGCRNAVLTFLSAWTSELHRLGYVSGVYENLNLGARDLAGVYDSASYARPDALWIARYDQDQALTGWAGIADGRWAVHQRAKQFSADLSETHGGVTLNIDADHLDAPVATTAFGYRVTSGSSPAVARTGPGGSYPAVTTYPAGADVTVACQAPGSGVRHHHRVGQAHRRQLRHRCPRGHAVRHRLQRAGRPLPVPVPGDGRQWGEPAGRPRRLVPRSPAAAGWGTRLGGLPAGGNPGGRHPDLVQDLTPALGLRTPTSPPRARRASASPRPAADPGASSPCPRHRPSSRLNVQLD